MSDEQIEMPEGWVNVCLGEILERIEAGKSVLAEGRPAKIGEFGVLKVSAVSWGEFQPQENKAIPSSKVSNSIAPVQAGDLLISRANTVELVGAVVLVKDDYPNLLLSDKTLRIVPYSQVILKEFLLYALRTRSVRNLFEDQATGTSDSMRNLSQDKIRSASIPIPPFKEQKRIVAKIEELHDRLHRSKQALEAVPELCDRFRQSVLAAAFRGDLTVDWREENPDVEPASVLLERIKERRFELAETKRDLLAVQKTYSELIDSPVDNPSLPDGWLHCRINDIGNICNGSTPSRKELKYWDGSIPWVSSGEVRNNEIFQTREAITEEGYESTSVRLLPVSTVLLAMIGEGKTRGQTAILRIEATINQNIAAVILNHGLVLPEYLWYWFQYQYASTREAGSGSGPQALNCQRVREIPFVLAPLQEQRAVVTCIKNMLDSTEAIRRQLQLTVDHLAILNQSILAKAFRGELVEQDPNDEPASVLLDRIRAERQAQEGKKSGGARGKRKKANNDQLDLPGVE